MTTYEQALSRADAWINGARPPEDRHEIGILEFEDGYVVWPKIPKPRDITKPPDEAFGATGVVDRQTGEVSAWPNLSPDIVARNYSRKLRGEPFDWSE